MGMELLMTQKQRSFLTLDRGMIGFLILIFTFGTSWATLQNGVKTNALANIELERSYTSANAMIATANEIRFARIEVENAYLVQTVNGQALSLARIVTALEFIQDDLGRLVDAQK